MATSSINPQPSGPLAGVKIIDLTSVVLGPYATQMLGDLGADVIKVEAPDGDATRYTGPSRHPDMAALFMGINRNKRSIVLDLKQASGRDLLFRLIEGADVLVHNVRPQKLEKLGLGYEQLSQRFPSLIWCSISGYGRTGPYADRPGFDLMAQAMSGIMSFTGERPDGPPVKCGPPLSGRLPARCQE